MNLSLLLFIASPWSIPQLCKYNFFCFCSKSLERKKGSCPGKRCSRIREQPNRLLTRSQKIENVPDNFHFPPFCFWGWNLLATLSERSCSPVLLTLRVAQWQSKRQWAQTGTSLSWAWRKTYLLFSDTATQHWHKLPREAEEPSLEIFQPARMWSRDWICWPPTQKNFAFGCITDGERKTFRKIVWNTEVKKGMQRDVRTLGLQL